MNPAASSTETRTEKLTDKLTEYLNDYGELVEESKLALLRSNLMLRTEGTRLTEEPKLDDLQSKCKFLE